MCEKSCRSVRPLGDWPGMEREQHDCELQEDHWGPHLCSICGLAWARPTVPAANWCYGPLSR